MIDNKLPQIKIQLILKHNYINWINMKVDLIHLVKHQQKDHGRHHHQKTNSGNCSYNELIW